MAGGLGPKVKLTFVGDDSQLARTIAKVEAETAGLDKAASKAGAGLSSVGGVLAKLGAAGSAVQVIGGVAGALAQLAPAALLVPGALGAGAAAIGTYKLAMAGVADALAGNVDAMHELQPAAQGAVKAIQGFAPEWSKIQNLVQQNFFAQFAGQVKDLGGNYLPVLKEGLGDVATQMGTVAKGFVDALNWPATVNDVSEVLRGTAGFMRELGTAVGDATRGFTGIAGVGATYLPRLGEAIGGVALKFKNWVNHAVESGKMWHWIDGAIAGFKDLGAIAGNIGSSLVSIFKGLGGVVRSPLANLRDLTKQLADFLKTADAQAGLHALGDVLQTCSQVMRDVLMAALKQIAPLLVDLAPAAAQVAKTLGTLLVDAINTVGPILRGVATVLSDFPGFTSFATTAVVGFVAAFKLLKIANSVGGWIDGAAGMIEKLGGKADASGGKVQGFKGKLGLLKGVGVAAGLLAIADAFGKIDEKARATAGTMDHARDAVGQYSQAFQSLDFGFFFDQIVAKIKYGEVVWAQFKNNMTGWHPSPIKFDVNTGPARADVNQFLGEVNRATPMVNINGNNNGAGFALKEILAEIAAGKESVTIDGRPVPAQQALAQVVAMINDADGTVEINGQHVPAGQALAEMLGIINRSSATTHINGESSGAQRAIDSFVRLNDGRTINIGVNLTGYGGIGGAALVAMAHGRAEGGPIVGPGTGTSDTAGLYALSNGEYVATARQVDNAGGPAAFGRMMAALDRGPVGLAGGGMASTARSAMRGAWPSSAGGGGGGRLQLAVAPGADSALASLLMRMVRTGQLQLKAA